MKKSLLFSINHHSLRRHSCDTAEAFNRKRLKSQSKRKSCCFIKEKLGYVGHGLQNLLAAAEIPGSK
jgi:4-alpha-glucanotransferase